MKKSDAKYCYRGQSYYNCHVHGRTYRGCTIRNYYTNNPNCLIDHDGKLNPYYKNNHIKEDLKNIGLNENKIERLFYQLDFDKRRNNLCGSV